MAKVLILTNKDIGLYKFRKELIRELLKENEVFISLPKGEWVESLINMGCVFIETDVDSRGINPVVDLKLMFKYNKIIRDLKPDSIITYTIKPNIYGGIVSRLNDVNYTMNITGLGTAFQNKSILKKAIINMYKIAAKKAKIVFFENEENKETFIINKIVPQSIAYKLNGAGVNLEEYPFRDYPSKNGKIRFLFIGRIMKEKGIDELLEVAEKISAEYKNIYFDIVGPEEEIYIKKLKRLQENEVINYYGYQKDVKPFIEQSHCLILPSYHEGMANTLLESGAMGRPLITSNISGCKEAVVDGYNGYLTKTKDSVHLYKNVIKFLNLSHEERMIMGKHSRKHIELNFNKKDIVEKTIQKLKLV